MRGAVAGIVLVVFVLAGCVRGVRTDRVVFGPYPRENERELFDRFREAVRGRGYEVVDDDVTAGHFAVRANEPTQFGRAIFRFRFYRGGWVGVEVAGGGTRRNWQGDLIVPPVVHAEYAELVEALGEATEER